MGLDASSDARTRETREKNTSHRSVESLGGWSRRRRRSRCVKASRWRKVVSEREDADDARVAMQRLQEEDDSGTSQSGWQTDVVCDLYAAVLGADLSLRDTFAIFDADGSGSISAKELGGLLQMLVPNPSPGIV